MSTNNEDFSSGVAGSKLSTVIVYIVTNLFENNRWFYFLNLKHAEDFRDALKTYWALCHGCNKTVVQKMRSKYLEKVNPADYYCSGYVYDAQPVQEIKIYDNSDTIFHGIDNELGEVLVKQRIETKE